MLNLCVIVVAILKIVTGRNFSMSAINSGHHYLPTYQILMISDNVEYWTSSWSAERKEKEKEKEKEKKNNNNKNNKSPKLCLGDLIIIRNGAKTISLPNFAWET